MYNTKALICDDRRESDLQISAVLPASDGGFTSVEDVTSIPNEKRLTLNAGVVLKMAPQKLGFSAHKPIAEDETTLLHTGIMAMIEHDSRITEGLTGESADLGHPFKLGFDGTISRSSHGEHKDSHFPMAEFLRLADAVVDDGDETSKEAFMDNLCAGDPIHYCYRATRHHWYRAFAKLFDDLWCRQSNTGRKGLLPAAEQFSGDLLPETDSPTTVTDVAGVDGEAAKVAKTAASADELEKTAASSAIHVAREVRGDVKFQSHLASKGDCAPTGLFVGNIPLHTYPNPCKEDKIAHAFHNSTRKTLSYVAPTIQNGEVVVRPTIESIRNGSTRWKSTVVGYFLGKRPYFHHVKEYAMSVWPGLRELFHGQPIVLQKWESGMVLQKLKHTQVPVWIKLRHLPVELWTEEGLSTVASGVGRPLYPDAITRACTRLDFARVCVMMDVTSALPKHIIIMTPDEEGGESPCKIDVEYEWLPPKCTSCLTLGHSAKECALNKPSKIVKPPVSVYVPKSGPTRPPPMPDREITRRPPTRVVEATSEGRETVAIGPSHAERGKALVIYNAFDALHLIDDTEELNRGPKSSSPIPDDPYHQLAVKDIVTEFRLQFLDLLETRVRINNASQIQSVLLPHWKWFVDYGSAGNRVWITWDDNFVDINVVECGTQYIHCHVNIHALHESIAITVIYGANEMADRRELWGALENIALQCADIPWLVGGDFNAVRDLSEVCGTLRDIRRAMDEFNTCIQNIGLLPLPMQGEWYTWHNCSATPRNLWKRLDRILINDRWMARFQTSFYTSLTPRTSDHSPLVLYGDSQQQYGGVPMYTVTKKLKALKPVFREQRRNKGDLSHNVQLAKGFLEMAQVLVSSNRRDEIFLQLEHCCRLILAKAAKLEQIMLQQRAKMQWIKGGDQCSRVFFRKIA
ncbi:UNVERIFIED_CONTAM: hypothetical protein Sindi_0082800 [Sesamum indicum]